jgi:ADP-ribosylglycohydrolase
MAVLNRGEAWRRTYACWMGKNAGGTLGAPVEGQPGPHNFDWYPKLQEGGIPNDDLEMQLVWLDAIKRAGWRVDATVLAQAWLTHIGYNWCEYGIAKRNLRWGLLPPLSGAYDNDFWNDCMGSPIRSEIWACLAPASPRIAVRFAFEDAIVDHAGGEGVWGEMFNAALESIVFVKHDLDEALDLALAFIPPDCQIARAITDTRKWWQELKDWRKVRERIAEKYWHREPTHAPQNLAFTVLGLLASEGDFGKAITTAVNCGQDTDCTGATAGSVMGILLGEVPKKWAEPLGETIATNLSWGGIRNIVPLPDVRVLTDEVVSAAQRLLAWHGAPIRIADATTDLSDLPEDWLRPDDGIYELWERNKYPWRVDFELNAVQVGVDYRGLPTINPEVAKTVSVWLLNREPIPLTVTLAWDVPSHWQVEPMSSSVTIPAKGIVGINAHVCAPVNLPQTQTLWVQVRVHERPSEVAVPVTLIGERKWLVRKNGGEWQTEWLPDSQLPLERWFGGKPGVVEAKLWVWSPSTRPAVIGFPCNAAFQLSFNGAEILNTHQPDYLVRPGQQGPASHYARVTLRQGWNEVSLRIERHDRPVDAYLLFTDPTDLHRHLTDIVLTQSP